MALKRKNNKKIDEINEIIIDFKESIENGLINIYPIRSNDKKPDIVTIKGEKLTHDKFFDRQFDITKIRYNHNIGIVAGYKKGEHKAHIAFIDIDGYKKQPVINGKIMSSKYWYDEKIHEKVTSYLFDILKGLDIGFIPIKTWSKGYHLIFFTNDEFKTSDLEILNRLCYPKDFFIKELQGKPLNFLVSDLAIEDQVGLNTQKVESIELIAKSGLKVMVGANSKIKETRLTKDGRKETRKGQYEIITTEDKPKYSIKELYENPVSKEELEEKIKKLFLEKGFAYKEPIKNIKRNIPKTDLKKKIKHHNVKNNIFNDSDKKILIRYLSDILDSTNGSHNQVLQYLTSGLQSSKLDSDTIYFLLTESLKQIDDCTKEHRKQIKSTLNNTRKDKKGYKSLMEEYQHTKETLLKIFKIINKYVLNYNGEIIFLKTYIQKNRKIYQMPKVEDRPPIYKADFSIDELTRHKDLLGISEAKYTITYYNGFDEELVTLEKYTFQELLNKLYNDKLFNTNKQEAEKILNCIIHGLEHKGLLNKEETIIHKGFFIDDNNKLISNTNIDNLKTSDEELKEAILLLIELLEENDNTIDNNSYVLRKCLSMPFNYCIKQLGYSEDNTNGLILYGKAKTGKTSILLIGLWFYLEEPYNYNASTDTLAGLQTVLNGTTFYSIFDDSYNLLKQDQVQNTLKKGMYEKYSRSVYDINNKNDELKQYKALSTPTFSYNENIEFNDEGIRRRFDKIFYNSDMVMSDKQSKEFKKKYKPFTKDSILSKLHHIGIAFTKFIKPYLENNDDLLVDLDQLTILFFKETFERLDIEEFKPLITEYSEEVEKIDIKENIKSYFNDKLLKIRQFNKKVFNEIDFRTISEMGIFNWLKYQPVKERFVIDAKLFTKECNKIINQSLSIEDLQKELGIYGEIKQIKVADANIKGFVIEYRDLKSKIFNLDLNSYD